MMDREVSHGALRNAKNGKAVGVDNISVDILKNDEMVSVF